MKTRNKVVVSKFALAREVVSFVAFGVVLATVDVYSDIALSYQFFTVKTLDFVRGTATAKSSFTIVSIPTLRILSLFV